jgi:hypothetical protein
VQSGRTVCGQGPAMLTGHFGIYFAVVGQINFHPDPSCLVHNNPTVFCLMLSNLCNGYSVIK